MIDVAYDEIALDDERRIRAIVKRLGLPPLGPGWLGAIRFGRSLAQLAYWERYLLEGQTTFTWHQKSDVWLTPNEKAGLLRRVVIKGLSAEKDAKVLRSEAWRFRLESGQPLTHDEIKRIATEVKQSRPERDHQEVFHHALSKVRHHFRWEGDEVVEGDGWLLPLKRLRLRDDEVELLRRVFASLPRTFFTPTGEDDPSPISLRDAPCPLCGGAERGEADDKQKPLNDRRVVRRKVEEKGFMGWVNARLTDEDKPGVWSQPRQLFGDYVEWTRKRRREQTDDEYAEAKAAEMSDTAWGTLMGKMYGKRRDGKKGAWYNVRLKKRNRAA